MRRGLIAAGAALAALILPALPAGAQDVVHPAATPKGHYAALDALPDWGGVWTLEFKPGVNRKTLNIDGTEIYDVVGERTPLATLTLVITRRNGERVEVPVTCRLDTAEEVSIYDAGGVLQRFAQDFLESATPA